MALGAVALLPILRGTGALLRALERRDVLRLVGVCVGLAAYQAGYFVAVERAGVAIATLVTLGLAPVLLTLAERVRTRRRTPARTVAGVVLALVGLLALVGRPGSGSAGTMVGVAFAAASSVGYVTMALVGSSISARMRSSQLSVLAFVGAALLLVPATAATVGLSLGTEPVVWGAMLYLGILPTAVAYRLYFAGLPSIPSSAAGILVLLEPLTATALAVPLLGERLTPLGWAGAGALVVAVALVTTAGRAAASSGLNRRR